MCSSDLNGDAWAGIGAVYFETARYEEAATMFDKALALGATLSTDVCRQHLMSCDRGSLRANTKEVSFVRPNGQTVFSGAPSAITTQGAQLWGLKQAAYVGVRVSGKNYSLFYVPDKISCTIGLVPECPEPGFTQQKLFANYVHRTIQKMVAGEFAKTVQPPAATGTTGTHPVVPGGALGPFRHGTLVMKVGPQDLELAPSPAQATNTHVGVDLVGSCGTTPIYAFSDGVVEDLIDSPNDSNFKALGYMVLVRHNEQIGGRETRSIYLHMDQKPKVSIGESVQGGSAILGVVGQTGAAQGCHTHFEIRHFAGRLLQDPGWNDPANIYGKADQRSTVRFRDNWEDPETISRQYSRPLITRTPNG